MNELEKIWDCITERNVATEEELRLVTTINGYNAEALNDVIYARTGYCSIEQLEIGEELDAFLPRDSMGHLSRVVKHDILLQMLNDSELEVKLSNLLDLVRHLNAEDEELD